MAVIRNQNEIILNFLDFYRLVQPDLTTNPGSVNRDVFIEAPSAQLALLYEELSSVSSQQAFRLVSAADLDKLASNYGLTRKQPTTSSGVALLSFSSVLIPLNVNKGNLVFANNGATFSVSTGVAILPSNSSFYKSVAAKYRDQLDSLGISDQYAVEVTVTATSAGSSGNIGKYTLNKTSISGVSNVTNLNVFNGGNDQESDAAFRNRALSTFNGSSVGTSLGYLNTALAVTNVQDAVVIEPGNPLMTRDGTITITNSDRSKTIVSEGTGGKVDVVMLGSTLTNTSDSFIYRDKSNSSDPTNVKNDVVLGQIVADVNKTINRKRIDNLKSGTVPQQPVDSLVTVTGSLSGSNFKEKVTDSYGRVSGNYELKKDTGSYSGSVFGFDAFHWISDRISNFQEDKIKGQYNGQDSLNYTDVVSIPAITQNIVISNENSTVTFDRSIIQLLHKPVTNVTRVFNVTTGERYLVTNQNFDQTPVNNTTGRIKISGSTLPAPTDTLQVDYSWVVSYDPYVDYDGLETTSIRTVQDSVDWGYSSFSKENVEFVLNNSSTFYTGITRLPITTVLSASTYQELHGQVQVISSGIYTGRLSLSFTNLPINVESVTYCHEAYTDHELFHTAENNGVILSSIQVFGIQVVYNVTLVLPTDANVEINQSVVVHVNSSDVFANGQGTSGGTLITIPASSFTTTPASRFLDVEYIAAKNVLLSSSTNALPYSRFGNSLVKSNVGSTTFANNEMKWTNLIVKKNVSNQYYVDLGISALDSTLFAENVVSTIRTSDSVFLSDGYHPVTVATDVSNLYQLILPSWHSPQIGDRVIVFYTSQEIGSFEPTSFASDLVSFNVATLSSDPDTNLLSAPITSFTMDGPFTFDVLNAEDGYLIQRVYDGYMINVGNFGGLTSSSFTFASIPDMIQKRIKIYGSTSYHNHTYPILGFFTGQANTILVGSFMTNLDPSSFSVVRLRDGKELFFHGSRNDTNVLLASDVQAGLGDAVAVITHKTNLLNYAPTKLSVTLTDQVINPGTLTILGKTLTKAKDIIFTATSSGLIQNINEAVRASLSLLSTDSLPIFQLTRVVSLEKVSIASDGTLLSIDKTFDVKGTGLFSPHGREVVENISLLSTQFQLPASSANMADSPVIGDTLRITFYYEKDDSESLTFTKNGTLITNKIFSFIDRIIVSSGFSSSNGTKLTITSTNQPTIGSRYKVTYDYTSPKQNERITINYNYNSIIATGTFAIEGSRPVNADVLVRAAKKIILDLTVNIVIAKEYLNSKTTVLQNVRDKLTSLLTSSGLNQVIDDNDILSAMQTIDGVNRIRVLYFNVAGSLGSVTKIQANEDEYFLPGLITINQETR